MTEAKILHEEENLVSLRRAVVQDDGALVSFTLAPRWRSTAIPGTRNYVKSDLTWLYRHRRPLLEQALFLTLGKGKGQFAGSLPQSGIKRRPSGNWAGGFVLRCFFSLESGIKPMKFTHPPEMRLLWGESGNSVALFINGEPWAFIHEEKNHGYSKGVLRASIGNPWDQALFENTFLRGVAAT